MLQFAANLTFLFTELPFLERFSAARQAGFSAVEFGLPYDYPLNAIRQQLRDQDLQMVLCNLPAGDWTAGDRGTAANPARQEEFRRGVALGIETAKALGASRMNCLVGLKTASLSPAETLGIVTENLRYAAEALAKAEIRLMVEPINHLDMPGFALNTCGQVLDLIREIGHPNLHLQFDVYHVRKENGDLAAILRDHTDRIGHIQIADCPGRHQPGTGEIDFTSLLSQIDGTDYRGFVSLEYIPTPDTLTSLRWLSAYGYSL